MQINKIEYVKYVSTGIWIIALYVVFLTFVLFSLSIYQFQRKVETLPIDQYSLHEKSIFIGHECDISALKGVDLSESSIVVLPCLIAINENTQTIKSVSDYLFNHDYNINQLNTKKEKSNQIIDELRSQLKDESEDAKAKEFIMANIDNEKKNIKKYKEELEKINNVEGGIKKFEQLSIFYNQFFSILNTENGGIHFLAIPRVFLSILLSLSMGGLGSMIFITVEFLKIKNLKRSNINYAMFIFRPMLGAILALASYIIIKSGQISISGETAQELSPFFLATIGIISGIISEKVYTSIVRYGDNIVENYK